MLKTIIKTKDAPEAIGPYSQAVKANLGEIVFTAGQIPVDPDTGEIIDGDIELQTERVLLNLKAVVEASGSSLDDILKTTVFLSDMNDYQKMNQVYAKFFKENPPARSAVEVARLPKDVLIEAECIAIVS